MKEKKTLGVLGGLGPMSSVFFYELVTENTKAEKDQDHLDIIISSKATTPDRTAYILGESSENPLPIMKEEAKKLVNAGAGVIALTCNTAHYFYEELQASINVPILNIGQLAVEHVKELGFTKIGLLATTGTVKCGIYQEACQKAGLEYIVPDEKNQDKVMHLIYNQVKMGKKVNVPMLYQAANSLFAKGAEAVILGCTELSVIKRNNQLPDNFIDPLMILAKKAITECGGELKTI